MELWRFIRKNVGVPTTSKNVSFTSMQHIINIHQKVALYTVYVRQFILNTLLILYTVYVVTVIVW